MRNIEPAKSLTAIPEKNKEDLLAWAEGWNSILAREPLNALYPGNQAVNYEFGRLLAIEATFQGEKLEIWAVQPPYAWPVQVLKIWGSLSSDRALHPIP